MKFHAQVRARLAEKAAVLRIRELQLERESGLLDPIVKMVTTNALAVEPGTDSESHRREFPGHHVQIDPVERQIG